MITKERFHVGNFSHFLHQLCKLQKKRVRQVVSLISFYRLFSISLPILILLLSFSTDFISRGHHGQNDLLLA
jgi:uncharacterized BrkB/YihY/UPF0761 family membrane protein